MEGLFTRLLREEGFGIRLEDDILITEDGPLNLSESIPIESEEVESIKREDRADR